MTFISRFSQIEHNIPCSHSDDNTIVVQLVECFRFFFSFRLYNIILFLYPCLLIHIFCYLFILSTRTNVLSSSFGDITAISRNYNFIGLLLLYLVLELRKIRSVDVTRYNIYI